jgi:8-oxo-dGTP pyrophosphatase MutT (NUDIX family)
MENKIDIGEIVITCRGIILYEEKLLIVKHSKDVDFYVFPGGKLEFPENPIECMKREITEELEIKPEIGRLLYVQSYFENKIQRVEFMFEITNGKDYLNAKELNGTHKFELFDILWVGKNENIKILPEKIYEDFSNNSFPKETKFI